MSWILIATAPWLGLASLSARWGAMAAEGKGRPPAEGFLLGLALGPAGYLIAETLPRHPDDGDGLAEESPATHPLARWTARVRRPGQCCECEMRRTEALSEMERSCYERTAGR